MFHLQNTLTNLEAKALAKWTQDFVANGLPNLLLSNLNTLVFYVDETYYFPGNHDYKAIKNIVKEILVAKSRRKLTEDVEEEMSKVVTDMIYYCWPMGNGIFTNLHCCEFVKDDKLFHGIAGVTLAQINYGMSGFPKTIVVNLKALVNKGPYAYAAKC